MFRVPEITHCVFISKIKFSLAAMRQNCQNNRTFEAKALTKPKTTAVAVERTESLHIGKDVWNPEATLIA